MVDPRGNDQKEEALSSSRLTGRSLSSERSSTRRSVEIQVSEKGYFRVIPQRPQKRRGRGGEAEAESRKQQPIPRLARAVAVEMHSAFLAEDGKMYTFGRGSNSALGHTRKNNEGYHACVPFGTT